MFICCGQRQAYDKHYYFLSANRGILAQIIIDEDKHVIDGAHRLRAAHKLGLKTIPTLVVPGLSEDEKYELALALNLHRRHLTPLELAQIAKKNKKLLPKLAIRLRQKGQSYRQIADALGVSHQHVRNMIVKATVNKNTVDLPDIIEGRDGKKRSAKVKPKAIPAVYVNTSREIQRAAEACHTAGADRFPNKIIPLKQAERIAKKKANDDLRQKDYQDFKQGQATLLLGDFRFRCSEIVDSSFDLRNNQRSVIGGRSVLGDWVEDLVGHVEKFDTHRYGRKAIDAELLACGVRSFRQAVCMKDQAVPRVEAKGVLWFVGKTLFLDANEKVLARQPFHGCTVGADQKGTGMSCAAPRYLAAFEVNPGSYES
ncbi:MAG: ParB/RepB/Spo0J family partition protein [Planctomycetes bacterium]|nr:ParB/RepB/Spo0J family partition protein [Planctomycetota bacterium]